MSVLIDLLHRSSLAATTFLSFRLFRDLADLSQWIVQTPRDKTMWAFFITGISWPQRRLSFGLLPC